MTTTTNPVRLCCPECGGEDIVRDATARWCHISQEWELSGVQDTMTCQECDAEFYEAAEIAV